MTSARAWPVFGEWSGLPFVAIMFWASSRVTSSASTTGELVARFPSLCRTNVMKHLDNLVAANLVVVRREGRTRWNYLNPAPIQRVCDRWVTRHISRMASAMSRLKDHVEGGKRGPTKKRQPKGADT